MRKLQVYHLFQWAYHAPRVLFESDQKAIKKPHVIFSDNCITNFSLEGWKQLISFDLERLS